MTRIKSISDIYAFAERILQVFPFTSIPSNVKISVTVSDEEWESLVRHNQNVVDVRENIVELMYYISGVRITIKRETHVDKFNLMMERMNRSHHSKGHLKT